MGDKRTSILDRTRKVAGDPDAAVEATTEAGNAPAKRQEPGAKDEVAAAVALAIDRGRRASRPPVAAFKLAEEAGPNEWATSGRLAQVNRSPARDPWNR